MKGLLKMFAGPRRRRVTIATYPDGQRCELRKERHCGRVYWLYHSRGSAAFPLSVAKAEARREGATISTEYRP